MQSIMVNDRSAIGVRQWAYHQLQDGASGGDLLAEIDKLSRFIITGALPEPAPRLYDAQIDAYRNVTQSDVDTMLDRLTDTKVRHGQRTPIQVTPNGDANDGLLSVCKTNPRVWFNVGPEWQIRWESSTSGWLVRRWELNGGSAARTGYDWNYRHVTDADIHAHEIWKVK